MATIQAAFLCDKEITVLAVVVLSTSYHSEVSIVFDTNSISECRKVCDDADYVPEEWQFAFVSLQSGFGGLVWSTNKIKHEL